MAAAAGDPGAGSGNAAAQLQDGGAAAKRPFVTDCCVDYVSDENAPYELSAFDATLLEPPVDPAPVSKSLLDSNLALIVAAGIVIVLAATMVTAVWVRKRRQSMSDKSSDESGEAGGGAGGADKPPSVAPTVSMLKRRPVSTSMKTPAMRSTAGIDGVSAAMAVGEDYAANNLETARLVDDAVAIVRNFAPSIDAKRRAGTGPTPDIVLSHPTETPHAPGVGSLVDRSRAVASVRTPCAFSLGSDGAGSAARLGSSQATTPLRVGSVATDFGFLTTNAEEPDRSASGYLAANHGTTSTLIGASRALERLASPHQESTRATTTPTQAMATSEAVTSTLAASPTSISSRRRATSGASADRSTRAVRTEPQGVSLLSTAYDDERRTQATNTVQRTPVQNPDYFPPTTHVTSKQTLVDTDDTSNGRQKLLSPRTASRMVSELKAKNKMREKLEKQERIRTFSRRQTEERTKMRLEDWSDDDVRSGENALRGGVPGFVESEGDSDSTALTESLEKQSSF